MKQPTDEELDRYIQQLYAVRSTKPTTFFWTGTKRGLTKFRAALQQLAKKHGWDKPTNTKGKQLIPRSPSISFPARRRKEA